MFKVDVVGGDVTDHQNRRDIHEVAELRRERKEMIQHSDCILKK